MGYLKSRSTAMRQAIIDRVVILLLVFGMAMGAALIAPLVTVAQGTTGESATAAPPEPITVVLFGAGLAALSLAATVQRKKE